MCFPHVRDVFAYREIVELVIREQQYYQLVITSQSVIAHEQLLRNVKGHVADTS